MHICFITSEFPKAGFPHGGVGTFVSTLAPLLVKKGIQVSVIGLNYTNNSETEQRDGIMIYRLAVKKLKGLQWYFNAQAIQQKIKAVHAKNSIDVIETAELGLAFLSKIKGIKYIIRLHGGHHFFAEGENRGINWWKGFQEKRSFAKADGFIAVSNYVKEHTSKYLSYHNKPIDVIANPIALDKFLPNPNLQINQFEIVFAGTVCEKKGIRQLIEAFQYVKVKYPKATLQVYGRDWYFPDGSSYIKFLKNEFKQDKLKEVVFHGAVNHNDLPILYQQAHVCVFPSHIETQGLVAPEAMAMEKCVIFSQTGPGPETIVPFKTGLLCNPHNPNDIAEKIFWVFENQIEQLLIGKNARQSVITKFNVNLLINKNINYFNNLCLLATKK